MLGLIAFASARVGCRRDGGPAPRRLRWQPWFEEIAARAGITSSTPPATPRNICSRRSWAAARRFRSRQRWLARPLSRAEREPASERDTRRAAEREPDRPSCSRNRGDGTFEDVTERSGAGARGYGMGVTAGDFDNDGFTDLYVTNFGRNVLLRNDGHGHLVDVTAKAGVASAGWSTSAAFVDYDGDGALDLFVAHYLNWRPSAEVECFSLTGVPDYCSPASYDLPSASDAVPQQRRRHLHRRLRARRHCSAPSATASASSPAISTATAASTSSSPTIGRRIICG